jgi:hypothetical protein
VANKAVCAEGEAFCPDEEFPRLDAHGGVMSRLYPGVVRELPVDLVFAGGVVDQLPSLNWVGGLLAVARSGRAAAVTTLTGF